VPLARLDHAANASQYDEVISSHRISFLFFLNQANVPSVRILLITSSKNANSTKSFVEP
jgi:hypothetical protein